MRKKLTKQNKKRPQADLSTGEWLIPLAITLIFPNFRHLVTTHLNAEEAVQISICQC